MAIRRIAVENDVYNSRLLLSIVCVLALYNEVGPGKKNRTEGRSLGLPPHSFILFFVFYLTNIYIYIYIYIDDDHLSHSLHQCSTLPADTSQCPLGPDYYTLNGTNSCLPCSVCDRGQGIFSSCSETGDTVCIDCGEGTYSKITSLGRVCYPCTMCAQEGKSEVSPCSPTEDSTCGECASGFFLYIDSGGSECKVCSQCPQDRVVIHWIECAEAGLPLDMQCAPGMCECANIALLHCLLFFIFWGPILL